jgi:hypothetical protein
MTTISPDRTAGIGHNRMPIDEQAIHDFHDALRGIPDVDIRAKIAELRESAERAFAVDDDSAGRCAELIRQMTAVEKAVEDCRKDIKAPYFEAGNRIDDAAKGMLQPLVQPKERVVELHATYMRKKAAKAEARRNKIEENRQAERERAKKAADAERELAAKENRPPDHDILVAPMAIPAAPAVKGTTKVRSNMGSVSIARPKKVGVIVNWAKAYKAVESVPKVQDAIQAAVNALITAGQTKIPGVELEDDFAVSVRG